MKIFVTLNIKAYNHTCTLLVKIMRNNFLILAAIVTAPFVMSATAHANEADKLYGVKPQGDIRQFTPPPGVITIGSQIQGNNFGVQGALHTVPLRIGVAHMSTSMVISFMNAKDFM
jgi:hypothetical protein